MRLPLLLCPPVCPLLFSSLSIGTHICALEHMLRREDSLWESVPFFHCAGPQYQTQVMRLGCRHLSWLSHLSNPHHTFPMQLNCVFQLQKILIHFKYGFCLINFLFSLWLDVHTVLWTHVLFFHVFDFSAGCFASGLLTQTHFCGMKAPWGQGSRLLHLLLFL